MDERKRRARKQKRRRDDQRRARAAAVAAPAGAAAPAETLALAREALEAGQFEKAEKLLRRALRAAPEDAQALNQLAIALEHQDRSVEALAASRRCVACDPELASGHYNLGALLRLHGDLMGARAALRRALELRPDHADAWRLLAGVRRFESADDPDLGSMRAQLAGLPAADPRRVALSFALGKALEDLGDWDGSFEHYAHGNRRQRARITFDPARFADLVERTISAHDASFLAREPAAGTSAAAPILVVGMPRSGSTLLEQILASHPDVEGVGEVLDLERVVRSVGDGSPESVAALEPEELARLGRAYAERLRRRAPQARRIVDKCLKNALYLGLVARALPGARIVHAVREPLDNCFACYKVLFSTSVAFAYDLAELGVYFRHFARLMDHWRASLGGRLLDVHYEALVAGQERETRRLLDFCGLEWHAGCLDFHETRRKVTSASATQVRSPLHAGSVGKWRRFREHLGPLIEALGPLAAAEDRT